MGSKDGEGDAYERPRHKVTIARPFAVGKYPVTFAEWDAALAAGAVEHKPSHEGWGGGRLSSTSTGKRRRRMSGGYRPRRACPTGCSARRSGNIAAGRGRKRRTPPATRLRRRKRNFPAVFMAAPAKRLRRAHFPRTHSACTTCMATSGNGARIAGTTIIITRPAMAQRGQPAIAAGASFVAVPGTPSRVIFARRAATTATQTSASAMLGSGSPGR